ncbi:MAG: hypothetical protein JO081_12045 [Alphaproteobacteria bacterium]|nr:hypothetical protein [Alphaproteobacteria bacterium]
MADAGATAWPIAHKKAATSRAIAATTTGRSFTRPDQISDSFVDRIRHPNPGQLASPMQPGKPNRVAPVGLDALTGPLWDRGRAITMPS